MLGQETFRIGQCPSHWIEQRDKPKLTAWWVNSLNGVQIQNDVDSVLLEQRDCHLSKAWPWEIFLPVSALLPSNTTDALPWALAIVTCARTKGWGLVNNFPWRRCSKDWRLSCFTILWLLGQDWENLLSTRDEILSRPSNCCPISLFLNHRTPQNAKELYLEHSTYVCICRCCY